MEEDFFEVEQEKRDFVSLLFDPIEYLFNEYTDQPQPITTYLNSLDNLLNGGLQPGVWCIMAEPGAGKSAFGLQLAWYTAYAGTPSLYISLEMPAHQCWARVASAYSYSLIGRNEGISPFRWSDVPKMGIAAREAIKDEQGIVDKSKITQYSDPFIDATNKLAIQCRQLFITDVAQARDLGNLAEIIRCSKTIDTGLVVVDYMQQIQTGQPLTVYDRITEVSAALKDIANELKIPIVVIVSMNRETLKGAGKDLSMHGGSGSAAIEYDAVGVMTLQHIEDKSDELHRRVRLKVQKNRFGMTGKTVDLDFYPAYNVFYEAPKEVE